jgi:hypothetical protein
LVLRSSPTDKATLTLDVVTASLTSHSALDSSAFSMANAFTPRVMVVKQMDRESSVVPVVSVADAREMPQRIPRESATTASEISVAVFGDGFHRRVRVDLAPTTKLCPGHDTSKGNILLVVPLSTSVYADLDELRVCGNGPRVLVVSDLLTLLSSPIFFSANGTLRGGQAVRPDQAHRD